MPSAKNTSEVMRERVAKVARFSFCQKIKRNLISIIRLVKLAL